MGEGMDSEEVLIAAIAAVISLTVLYAAYWPIKWIIKWLRLRAPVIEQLKAEFKNDDIPSDPEYGRVARLDQALGFTERFVAVSLILIAPRHVAFFIAGWVALKFAANWKRKEGSSPWEKKRNARYSLIALIGSAASFAVAVAVGLALRCVIEEL